MSDYSRLIKFLKTVLYVFVIFFYYCQFERIKNLWKPMRLIFKENKQNKTTEEMFAVKYLASIYVTTENICI